MASGDTWRPNPTLEAAQAAKLRRVMEALGASAAGVINKLIARMNVDEETGLPVWDDVPATTTQGTLVDRPASASRRAA